MKLKIIFLVFFIFLLGCSLEEDISVDEAQDVTGEAYKRNIQWLNCTDSDSGRDKYTTGIISYAYQFENGPLKERVRYDECVSEKKVREYFCKFDAKSNVTKPKITYMKCSYNCTAGACVNVTATE